MQKESLGLFLRNALEFLSSLIGRSWHSNSKLLQQISGIGQVGANSLFNAGIRSIDAIRSADDSRLEILLKRNPPFGRNVKKIVSESFPLMNFECELKDRIMKITLKSTELQKSCFQGKQVHLLVVAYKNPSTCRTLHYDQIPLSIFDGKKPLNRTVNIKNCTELSYSCSLMFEDWSGLNQNICFEIEPSKEDKDEEEVKGTDPKQVPASVSPTKAASDIDFLSDFDFDFDYSETLSSRHKEPHPNIPLSPISTKSQISSKQKQNNKLNSGSCKHTCKDKFNCAHVCCKAGLLKRPAETALQSQTPKKPSFLSGAKRSLTNAREYLRKYQPINIQNGVNIISNLQPTVDESDLFDEIEIALRYKMKRDNFFIFL